MKVRIKLKQKLEIKHQKHQNYIIVIFKNSNKNLSKPIQKLLEQKIKPL